VIQVRPLMLAFSTLFIATLVVSPAAEDKPIRIKPEEARQHIGKKVEVVFEVKASKNSVKRKTVYLDSEMNFQDEKNLGVAISETGVTDLKQKRGVDAPDEYYRGKSIRVVGVVVKDEDRPYIKVDEADQLDLADAKSEK